MEKHEVKKVDFFSQWAKQFESGYKGPRFIDNIEPHDLFFCGGCHFDEAAQINPTPRIIQVEIDQEYLNSAYSIFDNSSIKVLTGVFNSLVNSIQLGELPNGDYTLCLGEDSRQTFMVFTLD